MVVATRMRSRVVALRENNTVMKKLNLKIPSAFCCKTVEPLHDKTNKLTCAPSEDSDQPGHPHSLISVFSDLMKKLWALSYTMSVNEDSDPTGRMSRLISVFAGRTGHCVGFVVRRLKFLRGLANGMQF